MPYLLWAVFTVLSIFAPTVSRRSVGIFTFSEMTILWSFYAPQRMYVSNLLLMIGFFSQLHHFTEHLCWIPYFSSKGKTGLNEWRYQTCFSFFSWQQVTDLMHTCTCDNWYVHIFVEEICHESTQNKNFITTLTQDRHFSRNRCIHVWQFCDLFVKMFSLKPSIFHVWNGRHHVSEKKVIFETVLDYRGKIMTEMYGKRCINCSS